MSVSDGQRANATNFNNAFLSRTAAQTSTVSKVDLENADAASGATVANLQREINSLNSMLGRAAASAYNAIPSWVYNEGLSALHDVIDRVDALSALFAKVAGHTHDGTDGQGGPLVNASQTENGIVTCGPFPQYFAGDKYFYDYIWARDQFSFYSSNYDAASQGNVLAKLGGAVKKITGTGPVTIGAIDAGTDGQVIFLLNQTAQTVTVTHEDTGETAGTRIKTLSGADLVLNQNQMCGFIYDSTMSTDGRWVMIFETTGTGSGGGGGSSVHWVEGVASPVPSVTDYNDLVYGFVDTDETQSIYALIKVPASYQAGLPIEMLTTFYSADTSGTALIRAQATLIRSGTDAISSTTNQRTTTNSAVTLSGATQNEPQAVTLDLTDGSGQINGVAVSAGDLIRVRLYRDCSTDTATGTVNVPVYGTEVTFS